VRRHGPEPLRRRVQLAVLHAFSEENMPPRRQY
jgi:hypothetical protein